MQKIHSHGTDGNRYFWNVSAISQNGDKVKETYRSRCATAESVKTQLKRSGMKNIRVSPTKAS